MKYFPAPGEVFSHPVRVEAGSSRIQNDTYLFKKKKKQNLNKEKEDMQTVNFECVMAKPALSQSWFRIRIETNMVPKNWLRYV
jgi:hypothetical protein